MLLKHSARFLGERETTKCIIGSPLPNAGEGLGGEGEIPSVHSLRRVPQRDVLRYGAIEMNRLLEQHRQLVAKMLYRKLSQP